MISNDEYCVTTAVRKIRMSFRVQTAIPHGKQSVLIMFCITISNLIDDIQLTPEDKEYIVINLTSLIRFDEHINN